MKYFPNRYAIKDTKWFGLHSVVKRYFRIITIGRKVFMLGKTFGIVRIRYGTNYWYIIYKKLMVIHSSYEVLDDTKWDVCVSCL